MPDYRDPDKRPSGRPTLPPRSPLGRPARPLRAMVFWIVLVLVLLIWWTMSRGKDEDAAAA